MFSSSDPETRSCVQTVTKKDKKSHIFIQNKNKNFFHDAKTTTAAAMFQYEFNVTFSLICLWKAQQKLRKVDYIISV